ncbi:MAG TPA: response regulator [Dehalococcoidia bacterium]|nr:response regulator [Dehalococcoidia bacterium]
MAKEKVLLVENDQLLSKAICVCLIKKGYEVKSLQDGEQAAKYMLQAKPDSIVVDLERLGCDIGSIAELLEKLGWTKRVPLILLSGLETQGGKVAEIKHWAHIQKPFDMGELVQTIEESLKKPKLSSTLSSARAYKQEK